MIKPTVAVASDFLDAFAKLQRPQQRKVRDFMEKFRDNPTSSAINFEKIHGVKDDKVRTVRIDQKYRAVILQPDEGNVYVLVWVDNHDEAVDWAKKKRFEVNPNTGSLQVINVTETEQLASVSSRLGGEGKGIFDEIDDATLSSFGVPAVLLPAIRAVGHAAAVSVLAKHLPAEAAEALIWLAEGLPVDEVRAALSQPRKPQKVDTSDFAAALDSPDSRRRFVKVSSQDELDRILDAPLDKWRIFLHPTQEELVRTHFNGPARVLGGAGTGKTVVAIHRARHLARDVFTGKDDRILFTTFTANLARDVERNLKRLCGDEVKRIEVTHLHAWAARFLRGKGVQVQVATDEEVRAAWKAAVESTPRGPWTATFLCQEWQDVVQVNGIETEADYLKVPRTGRGQTLSRPQRAQVWRAFVAFNEHLRSRKLMEWLGMIRAARRQLGAGGTAPYKAVVLDEAQDLHAEEWRLIRTLAAPAANDLFLVGDAHQRIYGRKVTLSRCGVNVVGRSRKLRVNYRTTEQIRAWAVAVLNGPGADDLDGGTEDGAGYRSLLSGPVPQVERFRTGTDEKSFLRKTLPDLVQRHGAENVCLVARTGKLIDEYRELIESLKLPCAVLDRASGEGRQGVRLATMHRVKGLEFPCLILGAVNAGVVPMSFGSADDDPDAKAEQEAKERSLLFVAATRARDQLLVTTWGNGSPFIEAATVNTSPDKA